jgi:predicted  nucleic acid-binding Zn-ribbon protein
MTINVYHHFKSDGNSELLSKIFEQLNLLNTKITKMGEKLDAINAQLAGINDATNNIAADLERLADQIKGGLTAAEADTVVASLQVAADKLKAIADINPEPPTV